MRPLFRKTVQSIFRGSRCAFDGTRNFHCHAPFFGGIGAFPVRRVPPLPRIDHGPQRGAEARAHGDDCTTDVTNVPTAYRHHYEKALTYPPNAITRTPTFTAVSALDR